MDESSDGEEEEIEGNNTPTAAKEQPQVKEPNSIPPRRYPLRNRKSSQCLGKGLALFTRSQERKLLTNHGHTPYNIMHALSRLYVRHDAHTYVILRKGRGPIQNYLSEMLLQCIILASLHDWATILKVVNSHY